MNIFQTVASIVPRHQPITEEERTIVKMFGGSAVRVRYCGDKNLVGLMILGRHAGIRIEQAPAGRLIRKMDVIKGEVIPSRATKKLRLKEDGRICNFVPNNYVY